jgi:hypothetical protein
MHARWLASFPDVATNKQKHWWTCCQPLLHLPAAALRDRAFQLSPANETAGFEAKGSTFASSSLR